MPLLPKPSTELLEDHLFGSGAFQFGWFGIDDKNTPFDKDGYHFPAVIFYFEDATVLAPRGPIEIRTITEEDFINGIKVYAEQHPTRDYADLLEDLDASDVDSIVQLIFWGEIRLS